MFWSILLLTTSFFCFVLATFGVNLHPRFNLQAAGLACMVGAGLFLPLFQ